MESTEENTSKMSARVLDKTTTSMDLVALNNLVVSLRPLVKKCKVDIVHKHTRQIHKLRKKKGSEAQLAANQKKADRLGQEIDQLKILSVDRMAKHALASTESLAQIGQKTDSESRVLLRVACHSKMADKVKAWRGKHDDWKALAAFMLYKNTGRRYKKAKRKITEDDHSGNFPKMSKDIKENKVLKNDVITDSDDTKDSELLEEKHAEHKPDGPQEGGILKKEKDICEAGDLVGSASETETQQKGDSADNESQSESDDSSESVDSDNSSVSVDSNSPALLTSKKKRLMVTRDKVKSDLVSECSESDESSDSNDHSNVNKPPVIESKQIDDSPAEMVVQKLELGKLTEQDLKDKDEETSISFLFKNTETHTHKNESVALKDASEIEVKPQQKRKKDNFFWHSDSGSESESGSEEGRVESGGESDDSGRGSGTHRPIESLFVGSLTKAGKMAKAAERRTNKISADSQRSNYSKNTNPNSGRGGLFIKQKSQRDLQADRGRTGDKVKSATGIDKKRPALASSSNKLHPSWEASKRRREQQTTIRAFSGKKTTFDD